MPRITNERKEYLFSILNGGSKHNILSRPDPQYMTRRGDVLLNECYRCLIDKTPLVDYSEGYDRVTRNLVYIIITNDNDYDPESLERHSRHESYSSLMSGLEFFRRRKVSIKQIDIVAEEYYPYDNWCGYVMKSYKLFSFTD